MRIAIKIGVLAVCLMAALGPFPRRDSAAQTVVDPAAFGLTLQELPAGAQIQESRVALTGAVTVWHLQQGRALPDGRVTNYYLRGTIAGSSSTDTDTFSYLVSIFATTDAARIAFNGLQDFWQSELANFGARAFEDTTDGFPLAHIYGYRDANGVVDSDLFFQRGVIVAEITLQDYSSRSRDERRAILVQIARALEDRANGATPPPTATPSPTVTATPTATATATPRPSPTKKPAVTPTKKPIVKATVRARATATRSVRKTPTSSARARATATARARASATARARASATARARKTSTPTLRPTATHGPTSVPAHPTATAPYGPPVKEQQCKPGYTLVKGHCTKGTQP